ncbi:MAG: hypothetical protein FWC26_00145 [Fibromonadales bacterium]|nr:hypothetical protein [Fibromonadales bacterium]
MLEYMLYRLRGLFFGKKGIYYTDGEVLFNILQIIFRDLKIAASKGHWNRHNVDDIRDISRQLNDYANGLESLNSVQISSLEHDIYALRAELAAVRKAVKKEVEVRNDKK